jgi:hypothetical protein
MSTFPDINFVDARGATLRNAGRDQINVDQVNFNIHNQTGAIQCFFALSPYILTCP